MEEIWKTVPDYVEYECSNLGRVRSWKPIGANQSGEGKPRDEPLIMTQSKTRGDYLMVGLSKEGAVKLFRMNRLVLLTFVGEPEDGMEACHNNGNRQDNRLANLRWDTPLNNNKDKALHGTIRWGVEMEQSKLTPALVREARRLYIPKHPEYGNNALAKRYGVSNPTMHKAIQGKTWANVKDTD